jgi:hypothetical protein
LRWAVAIAFLAIVWTSSAPRAFGQPEAPPSDEAPAPDDAPTDDPFEDPATPPTAPAAEAPERRFDAATTTRRVFTGRPAEELDEPAAAEPIVAATPAPPPADGPLRIALMDGSIITGQFSTERFKVDTTYGQLDVPVAALRSFTPGLASHPQLTSDLKRWIEQLGSSSYDQREAAQKALAALGPSIRDQLEQHMNDPDMERKTRIRAIIEEFDRAEEDADEVGDDPIERLVERDTIVTSEFTVVGRIVEQEFEIISRYGPLKVQLGDIRRVDRSVQEQQPLDKTVTVPGTELVFQSMKNTAIRLNRGDEVTITADGTVQMTPWGNQAMSTPDGAPNYGWYMPNTIAFGALIGKVGDGGDMFLVGSKKTFRAERSGVLQLAIAMQPNFGDQAFGGEYRVRVRVKPK